jgi:hypothetical protein
MKKIPLHNGEFVIVDDEDFSFLSRFTWQKAYPNPRLPRAVRTIEIGKKQVNLPMEYMIIPQEKGKCYHHKNHNSLDNRKENLQLLPYQIMLHSRDKNKISQNGLKFTSQFKGVSFDKNRNKWGVKISINGKHTSIGRFNKEIEAAEAYNKKAYELYGDQAYQNKIK